jgi:hypothetical protein
MTITVHARTRYATICLWLAQRLIPLNIRLADFVARQACVWMKTEAGPKPWRWERINVGATVIARNTPVD